MPCDTITESTVNLTRADRQTLADALKAAGWKVETTAAGLTATRGNLTSLQWTQGQPATLRGNSTTAADIARLYSRQVVLTSARKAGWMIKETAPGVFQATK